MLTDAPSEADVVFDALITLDSGQRFLAEQTWTADGRVHACRVRARLSSREDYGPLTEYRSWRSSDVRAVQSPSGTAIIA